LQKTPDRKQVLAKMHEKDEAFYRDLLEVKLRLITTKPYWNNQALEKRQLSSTSSSPSSGGRTPRFELIGNHCEYTVCSVADFQGRARS